MEEEELFTVGELANKMNTTVRTLQYYDKEGILKPSMKSEGGRRLYTKKDMILMHQIISMKYLGFSLQQIKKHLFELNTPEDVLSVLDRQREAVKLQIEDLTKAVNAIDVLKKEIRDMNTVDFDKYADILTLFRQNNEGYWVVKYFDDKLMSHIKNRFSNKPNLGRKLFELWTQLCDETAKLKKNDILPESEKGQDIAKRWWEMILEFTGGDLSLLPELMKFNNSKEDWEDDLKEKQTMADEFIEKALVIYLKVIGTEVPEFND